MGGGSWFVIGLGAVLARKLTDPTQQAESQTRSCCPKLRLSPGKHGRNSLMLTGLEKGLGRTATPIAGVRQGL